MAKNLSQVRVKRTRKLYDALLEAYREAPNRHRIAAEAAGCSRDAARKAWFDGWPEFTWGKPISTRIADEADDGAAQAERDRQERVRVADARRAQEDAERERARQERVTAIAEELLVVAGVRKSVMQAQQVAAALNPAVGQLVQVVTRAVFDVATGPDGRLQLTPKQNPSVDVVTAMRIVEMWGRFASKNALVAELAVQLGQEARGPDEAVRVAPQMTYEEAKAEYERMDSIFKKPDYDVDEVIREAASYSPLGASKVGSGEPVKH